MFVLDTRIGIGLGESTRLNTAQNLKKLNQNGQVIFSNSLLGYLAPKILPLSWTLSWDLNRQIFKILQHTHPNLGFETMDIL